ncbi:hypothetical protein [Nocardia sp. NPDC052566]
MIAATEAVIHELYGKEEAAVNIDAMRQYTRDVREGTELGRFPACA